MEQIIEESGNQESSSNKQKTMCHAKEGPLSIEQIQKDLKDNSRIEGQSDTANHYIIEDVKFIENSSDPGKNRKRKDIFDKGKAKRFFKSYKSSDILKSSYYHIQRTSRLCM